MFKCIAVKLFHERLLATFLSQVSEIKQQALLDEEDEEVKKRLAQKERKKAKRLKYKTRKKQSKKNAAEKA